MHDILPRSPSMRPCEPRRMAQAIRHHPTQKMHSERIVHFSSKASPLLGKHTIYRKFCFVAASGASRYDKRFAAPNGIAVYIRLESAGYCPSSGTKALHGFAMMCILSHLVADLETTCCDRNNNGGLQWSESIASSLEANHPASNCPCASSQTSANKGSIWNSDE